MGRCRFWGLSLAALGLGVLLTGAWMVLALSLAAWLPLAGAGLAWMAWAARAERHPPEGLLRFSGAPGQGGAWRWSKDSADEGLVLDTVQPALDLQNRLLLRLKGAGRVPAWVWVERARAPADWLALRRALLSDRPI